MNQRGISLHVAYLRHLGVDFADLRSTVLGLEIAPGRPALHTLSALYYRAQGMATRLADQVSSLDGSPNTQVPGRRESLDALRAGVGTASLAASDLAHALAATRLESIRFGGPTEHDEQFRGQERTEAVPVLTEHLQEAARQLELCSTVCRYVAQLGLVHHDASVSLARGRDITVTADGHRALARPPAPPSAPTPVTPEPTAVRTSGRTGR